MIGVNCVPGEQPVEMEVVADVDLDGVDGLDKGSEGRTMFITSCQSGLIVLAVLGGVSDGSDSSSSSGSGLSSRICS